MDKQKLTEGNRFSTAKRKWFNILTAIIVLAVGLSICVSAGAIGYKVNADAIKDVEKVVYENQLVPTVDALGNYSFTTDRDFKLMQLTDVHIGAGFLTIQKDGWALNAVSTMVSVEKPDLVIFTGDIAYPMGVQTGSFNNLKQLKIVADLMEKSGVYWTFVFGNHDAEPPCPYTKQDISDLIKEQNYTYCLFQEGPSEIEGMGNHFITVKNTQGLITHTFFMFDSLSYDEDGGYQNITQGQIDWYSNIVSANINANQLLLTSIDPSLLTQDIAIYQNPNSLMFFHIPLREYEIAWDKYALEGNSLDVNYKYGVMNGPLKPVNCGDGEDELFETALLLGSTTGIFVGHDHLNNFQIEYKGIRLTYGMSIDYTAFTGIHRQGSQRGCTLISLKLDGTWNSENSNYYQKKYESPGRNETIYFN